MDKRHLHHFWRKFRAIKPWYFLTVAIVFGVISVFSLRANNQHMVTLREAVYAADKSGQNVTPALESLRKYVYGHMNTDLATGPDAVYPPIQLKYTYDRLVTAESARVQASNASLYNDAQHYCEQQNSADFSGRNRVPCVTAYVDAHGAKVQPIPDGLYKFSFSSPMWSPDLAGWSVLLAVSTGILTVLVFVLDRWFKQNVA